jgi:hypothetical protein
MYIAPLLLSFVLTAIASPISEGHDHRRQIVIPEILQEIALQVNQLSCAPMPVCETPCLHNHLTSDLRQL